MRYLALATDYDNTLASGGRISGAALAALERLRASGRRAILVTGRRLEDVLRVCECGDLFDFIVAENGGVVYEPRSRKTLRFSGSRRRRSSSPRCVAEA